jgi:1-deoxy-D-xylulose-5-phosphate reductoisomerase
MKKVVVLGSTGSVGKQSLEVIKELGFKVVGLGCFKNSKLLKEQMQEFDCQKGAVISGSFDDLLCGEDAFLQLCKQDFDVLIAASSGLSALDSVLYSLSEGKRVALANKEIAVSAGELLKKYSKMGELIPVDSEHSAIFQTIKDKDLYSITLTCSGGALRDIPIDELATVTPDTALLHPNWKMGRKITIDCATMANKAFEVVEAVNLFDLDFDKVKVVMHKESLVHGFVTFYDGSTIAQISYPDMRLPIRYALTYPERGNVQDKLDLADKTLTFYKVDDDRYPIFSTIVNACKNHPSAGAFLAGVDEIAVERFLKGSIAYDKMHTIIKNACEHIPNGDMLNANVCKKVYEQGKIFALNFKV